MSDTLVVLGTDEPEGERVLQDTAQRREDLVCRCRGVDPCELRPDRRSVLEADTVPGEGIGQDARRDHVGDHVERVPHRPTGADREGVEVDERRVPIGGQPVCDHFERRRRTAVEKAHSHRQYSRPEPPINGAVHFLGTMM